MPISEFSGANFDTYSDIEFVLTYPSIDNITNQVLQLGRGCKLFKVDISCAFRHVPIDPGDLDLKGLHWGHYYINCLLPFILKHGSSIFQRLSNGVCHIMKQKDHQIWKYIDEFLCMALPSKFNILIILSKSPSGARSHCQKKKKNGTT